MFNVVCAARQYAELPSSASYAMLAMQSCALYLCVRFGHLTKKTKKTTTTKKSCYLKCLKNI